MNKPIILDSFTGGNSPLNWISCAGIVLSIIAIAIVVMAMLIEDLYKKLLLWILILIFGFTLILSAIGVKVSEEPGWKIYPNGVPLEEIETEYEVTDMDGLILTVYERK